MGPLHDITVLTFNLEMSDLSQELLLDIEVSLPECADLLVDAIPNHHSAGGGSELLGNPTVG